MKEVLILGGTRFIGRHLMKRLKADPELDITLFHRGKTNDGLYPNTARILGDRTTDDIRRIMVQDWDVVIDLSGYFPLSMQRMVPRLEGRVGRYIYLSTVSVYAPTGNLMEPLTEEAPTLAYTEEQLQSDDPMEHYGPKKKACEDTLLDSSLDTIILRPSIVYGKHDYTDRFYYWLYRAAKGMRFLLPGAGRERVTLTYVDDLAGMLYRSIYLEEHRNIYNLSTHPPVSMRLLIKAIREQLRSGIEILNAPFGAIEAANKGHVPNFPLFTNTLGQDRMLYDNARARTDYDVEFTPFELSVRQYVEQLGPVGDWVEGSAGMRRKREERLMQAVLAMS